MVRFRAVERAALGGSLAFATFTALSKKMRFCSGSAAFRATHPKFLFHLEIACVQDGISFISDSVSYIQRKSGKALPCANQGGEAWAAHHCWSLLSLNMVSGVVGWVDGARLLNQNW